MKQTRLEWLADRLEVLDEEIRDHESEARRHQHMADSKRRQLEIALDQYYAENAPILVSALSTFNSENLFTSILADMTKENK